MLDEVTCGIDGRFSTLTEASAECRAQGLQLCSLAEYEGCKRKGCHYMTMRGHGSRRDVPV